MRVAWVAHKGAGPATAGDAGRVVRQLMPSGSFVMADSHPDVILFMSGGSERRAIELADPDRPVLLLSIRGNNAYAAATEVMAWMNNNNRIAILSDADDAGEKGLLYDWEKAVDVWGSIRGKNAGLVGSVSEWLVASEASPELLNSVFGVSLEVIPWSSLPDYAEQEPDAALLNRFAGRNVQGLTEAAKVLTVLRQAVAKNNLSAVAVECFSLAQQRKVTACLALAQLNAEGTVAACEGDMASMAGMMLMHASTGQVPWMANTTRLSDKSLVLSHCTISFDLVRDVKLNTHFETDCSLAVDGIVSGAEVTLLRLSDRFDKAFITEGRIISQPHLPDACRTQAEIELPAHSIDLLRKRPLGNHLLVIPGRYAGILHLVCFYRGISVIS